LFLQQADAILREARGGLLREEANMPSPFPGMDPYLERRGLWEEVHAGLIVAIQQFLSPLVRPRYRVAIERRTYLAILSPDDFAGKPDVLIVASTDQSFDATSATSSGATPHVAELPMPDEVIERYLEVRDIVTGEVVAVIEILSPTNKLVGEGRLQYERKRLQVLASSTNLIEIDLLRLGTPLPFRMRNGDSTSDYRIVVSRAQLRPRADLYLFNVRDPIPDFPMPLRPDEPEPILPLNQILHELYDRAGYDLAIDYHQAPDPPLSRTDARWATQLLRHA
jgi:hypothetical protein